MGILHHSNFIRANIVHGSDQILENTANRNAILAHGKGV